MPEAKPHARNTERVLISLLPDDLLALDAIAAEIAEPGMVPNRSAAVREMIRDRMAVKSGLAPGRRKPGARTGR